MAAFLDSRIRYDQINAVNSATLSKVTPVAPTTLEDILALDQESRQEAETVIHGFAH